ncbi:MAG: GntR family transcriptional regulator [Rhizobiaceae bacterium]
MILSSIRKNASVGLESTFKPLESSTLNEDIYEEICRALRDGRLLPGQNVGIRQLADAVNTSPMPVREALRRLEAQGVLKTRPGRVLSIPGLDIDEVNEIYAIRITLEGLAAERAANEATPEEMANVQSICQKMEEIASYNDPKTFYPLNYELHMAIYSAAHMPHLLRIIQPLWLRVSPFLWSLSNEPHLRFAMEQHHQAVDALFRRDAPALRLAIETDIKRAQTMLEQILQK